jgi:hypothetical protein
LVLTASDLRVDSDWAQGAALAIAVALGSPKALVSEIQVS